MKKIIAVVILTAFLILLQTSNTNTEVKHKDVKEEINSIKQNFYLPTNAVVPKTKSITISFLGDCILGSYNGETSPSSISYYTKTKPATYFFEKCMPYIGTDDFTVANSENVFTDSNLQGQDKGYTPAYWFRNKSKYAGIYKANSIDTVVLENNHLYDYGLQGYKDTVSAFDKADTRWGDVNHPVILEKDGVKIAILNVMFGEWGSLTKTINQLNELKDKVNAKVVFFHSGEEFIHYPEQWKINHCHTLVDNGADLVIGAHPHVIQPFEVYKSKHILYSLGSLCFGSSPFPENRTLIYQERFTFDENNNLINQQEFIIPYYVHSGKRNNYQPCPINDEKARMNVLDFMYQRTKKLLTD